MGRCVQDKSPKPKEELGNIIIDVWEHEISIDFLRRLYQSMMNRIKEVIKAKGGPTGY